MYPYVTVHVACVIVDSEIASTLEMFGISATEDMDMVAQIKNEVRKLCTKGNIATQITINEADEQKHENLSRMIYENEKELKVGGLFITVHICPLQFPAMLCVVSCRVEECVFWSELAFLLYNNYQYKLTFLFYNVVYRYVSCYIYIHLI